MCKHLFYKFNYGKPINRVKTIINIIYNDFHTHYEDEGNYVNNYRVRRN